MVRGKERPRSVAGAIAFRLRVSLYPHRQWRSRQKIRRRQGQSPRLNLRNNGPPQSGVAQIIAMFKTKAIHFKRDRPSGPNEQNPQHCMEARKGDYPFQHFERQLRLSAPQV